MSRYDRIAPLVAHGLLGFGSIYGLIMGHQDTAVYIVGGLVVMALRNRE